MFGERLINLDLGITSIRKKKVTPTYYLFFPLKKLGKLENMKNRVSKIFGSLGRSINCRY